MASRKRLGKLIYIQNIKRQNHKLILIYEFKTIPYSLLTNSKYGIIILLKLIMEVIKMKWNEKVLTLMREKGISQKQLAQECKIAESSVSRYLKEDKRPRLDIVVNFAKTLGVQPEYLLDDTDLNENAFTLISTAIARKGKELTPEEKNKLIVMIAGMETDV